MSPELVGILGMGVVLSERIKESVRWPRQAEVIAKVIQSGSTVRGDSI